jgi:outer membrane lipoprotein-sorting protein
MKRSSAAAIALIGASLALASAHPAPSPQSGSPEALLFAAASAPATVSYTGTVQVMRMGSTSAEASVYRIEHRAPDLTRRVYTSPSSLAGDSVVFNGDVSFAVDTRRHRIVETRNGATEDSIARNLDLALLRRNYRVAPKGTETFDGRRAVDLMLVNKRSGQPAMFLRIDRASKIVLDKQQFGPDGSLVSEVRFTDIRFGVAIPPAHFALPTQYALVRGPIFGERTEDLNRVARNAGFAAREPRSLPGGFSPVGGNLVELRGVVTVHVLYSDGIRTVSLFESATASTLDTTRLQPQALSVAGRDAEYAEDGTTALLEWSDGYLYYTLVGELGRAELQQIATAIGKP